MEPEISAAATILIYRLLKTSGCSVKGLGETLAGFDPVFQVHHNGVKFGLGNLRADGFQRILKTDAGTHHHGQLVGKVQNIFSAGPKINLEAAGFLRMREAWLDADAEVWACFAVLHV